MRTATIASLLFLLGIASIQADESSPIKLRDEVGPLTAASPPIGDKPKLKTTTFAPGITIEFRFLGEDGAAAVLISTKIRADLPKDDRIIERIKPRYEVTRDSFGEGEAELRIIGDAPNRMLEFILLNNMYDDTYPQSLGLKAGQKELKTIGVTQIFVVEGRMVECALHLTNPRKLPRKEFIAEAQKLCTTWRQSVRIESAK